MASIVDANEKLGYLLGDLATAFGSSDTERTTIREAFLNESLNYLYQIKHTLQNCDGITTSFDLPSNWVDLVMLTLRDEENNAEIKVKKCRIRRGTGTSGEDQIELLSAPESNYQLKIKAICNFSGDITNLPAEAEWAMAHFAASKIFQIISANRFKYSDMPNFAAPNVTAEGKDFIALSQYHYQEFKKIRRELNLEKVYSKSVVIVD